ncbi:sensor histidine kinase [Cohnella thailandensis]|uniref:Histidine kinase n=1 Tax=Cohnella thailandensis TaxID=557557 RepID=A0A841SR58_9BACL|nr:histidine kinase [Cohnella thailandensis]MBB6634434.1 histidine kinase [Cohnella thailandensis]MBP1972066.1 two-component system sensor histidine kinase YesM [Cohnella thailandensis]
MIPMLPKRSSKPRTIRSRLILGFCLVTIPLLVVVLSNNLYATRVVHSQVAESNRNLLTVYMNDMDKALEEIENYLYKTAEQDQNVSSLSQYPKDSLEYYLAANRTVNDLFLNRNYYEAADVLFAYSAEHDELFVAPQQDVPYERKRAIQDRLSDLMREKQGETLFYTGWNVARIADGTSALVRAVDTGSRTMVGAWVDLSRLMQPLNRLTENGGGAALLVTDEGEALSPIDGGMREELERIGLRAEAVQGDESADYNIVELDQRYLLVSKHSATVRLSLILLLPEKKVLEGLPYFRVLTYWVPALAAILLVVYLIFLQKWIASPITRLIKGMRRIRSGDLSARLEDNKLVEFMAINETFNGMVRQIEHLKIDIYEEQIRTQKAELKHLQAQIHPHFFMNSLNIVYHLAQIRSFDIIQSLAMHLVRYFRYATRTQVSSLTMREEMDHIQDYLSIQKYRFPEALDYAIQVEPELEAFALPPLTVQPLVENAMVHGFAYLGGTPYRISIRVYAEAGEPNSPVCIEVADNGKGFAEGKAEELRETVHRSEPGERHVGLWNVVRRCRLFYKGNVRMSFENAEPRGAKVTLILPPAPSGKGGPSA